MSLNALGVISRAMRIFGQLAAGDTPGANDAADALIAFNAMKRAWFGTLIGPRLRSIGLAGTSGQAENGGEYTVPSGANFVLYAPTNPRPGDRFGWSTSSATSALTPVPSTPAAAPSRRFPPAAIWFSRSMARVRGSGIVAMGMGKKNMAIIAAFPVEESDDLMLITDQGQTIRVPVSGISIQGRGAQGVTLFRVEEGERVVSVERIEDVSEEGGG